jgi:cytochrome P450
MDALEALACKRPMIDGAAMFWTLPHARSPALLRLLVAYQVLADYLDCAHERAASVGIRNGLQLHRALLDAVEPSLELSDYYRFHPWRSDGGYVQALVERCRAEASGLPAFRHARPLVARAASLTTVLALNHEPDPTLREAELRTWASLHFPEGRELPWFEWAASASAWLTIFALFALTADATSTEADAHATYAAYLPWASLAGTMLDSYADLAEDQAAGSHCYVAYYADATHTVARVSEILTGALAKVANLRGGERHVALLSCMVAMYLSKDSSRAAETSTATRQLARAAGPLARALIPVLRAWRVLYGLQTDGNGGPIATGASENSSTTRTGLPPSPRLPTTVQTLAVWRDPHQYLDWCRRRYGTRFTIRTLGLPPLVFTSEPCDIRDIVRAPADVLYPGTGAATITPLVGERSFMLSEEEEHLAGRRATLPAFHHRHVQVHTEMANNIVRKEIASWPRDRPIAIHPYLRSLTLRVILRTIFDADSKRQRELHARLLRMLTITASLTLQEAQLRPIPPWRRHWQAFVSEREAVQKLIDELVYEEAHAPARQSGLLAMLLEGTTSERIHPDPTQVRDDLMSVILAGHETTASQLAWAFQLLAHHPATTARLINSLDRGEDRYLTATVQEVLRHRPVFLFTIPRVVNTPIEIAGYTFNPPVHLMGCIHLMQHDPAVYEDPDTFLPERFLDVAPRPEIWMPWGGGRRRCPGHSLALLEIRQVLKAVLSELDILPVSKNIETARWRSVIVTPGRGSRIILRRRDIAQSCQRGRTKSSRLGN